ncbi:MAG TPA: MBL fold metallo-hydrolase [Candidatus Eisenbacteria bacterium]|jgi:glyoxylase-like metal-dependent hydrolase (beta-lactamase superfamily II)
MSTRPRSRHALTPAIAAVILLLCPAARAQQRDLSAVEVKAEKVAEGIYMLTGAGGNIGISVGADGVLLIDDQFAQLSEKIRTAVAAITDRPIRFILNTHWHGDHTGGNENFARAGVTILAHDNVRRRLGAEQFNALFDRRTPPSPPEALPVVTFSDEITFHMNGDSIVAFHVPPAHTDGDAIVLFARADVVHMGDCFFNGMYPVIDVSAGGSLDGMIAAAGRMLARVSERTRIIPGHGPLGDRAGLRAFRDMLVAARDRIRPLVQAGKSADEVVAAKPTAELDAKWGTGFMTPERFVRAAYASLSGKLPAASHP